MILELLLRVRGLKYLAQRLQLAIHIEARPGYVCGKTLLFYLDNKTPLRGIHVDPTYTVGKALSIFFGKCPLWVP